MKNTILLLTLGISVVLSAVATGIVPKSVAQLRTECASMLYHLEYRQVDSLSTVMQQEAEKQNDRRMQAYAYFYKGAAQMMTGQGSIALSHLHQARQMALDVEDDTLIALTLNSLAIYEGQVNANMFVAQRYFMESLRFAERSHYETIKGGIYGNLSEVALEQKDTTGIKYALLCREQGRRENNPNLCYMGALHTAEFLHLMGHEEQALCHVDTAMNLNQKHHFHDIGVLHTLRGSILCNLQRLDEAALYCQMGIEMAIDQQPTQLPDAYYEYARVCYQQNDYSLALQQLNKAVHAAEENNSFAAIVRIYELMARCHEALGNVEAALQYLKQARDSADVVEDATRQHMLNERNLVIDMIEKEQEIALREAQMLTMQRTLIGLSVALMLLLTLMAVGINSYRRKTRLYHSIVQQNTWAAKREQELQQRIDALKQQIGENADNSAIEKKEELKSTPQNAMDDLWQRLQMLMEQERIFTDNQLDREKLAQLLGTNRTYLTTLIRERSGMNYTQFINSYRINEAVRILSDKQRIDYPLKNICADLGFGSMSHFHKLFRDTVGISPSIFRNSAMQI